MKVKAVRLGYYNLLRRKPGEVFDLLRPEDFSDANRDPGPDPKKPRMPGWMEKVGGDEDESVEHHPVAHKKHHSKSAHKHKDPKPQPESKEDDSDVI